MSEFNSSPEFEEKIRKAVGVPDAKPEFVDTLRMELARSPVKMKSRFVLLPAWAIALVLAAAVLIVSMPRIAAALGKLFGYVPGVGLVENTGDMRVLVEPVSVTRDGVTLIVTQALVYADHVQLVYEVSGIAPENNSASFTNIDDADPTAFCGLKPGDVPPTDGDARLRLPDGTMVDRTFDTNKYPENIFAMKPAYEVSTPSEVTELTMVLKCIPWAKLGVVPENWEVPLRLKYVPAETVIGEPVLEVTPSGTSSVSDGGLTVSLDKVVPQNDVYSFYVSIVSEEKNESVLAYFPVSAYLIDATKQKTSLIYNHPFSGSHDTKEPWELQTVSKPAYGPYTLVIDKVFTYYEETGNTFFEFDAGSNPQPGQTWDINQTLHLNGTDVRVISAKMVEKDLVNWGLSANTQGFEFSFEAADRKTPFLLGIMDRDLDHIQEGMIVPVPGGSGEPAEQVTIALYYEKGAPTGHVQVAINGQTLMVTGNWELQWVSPDQTGVTLLDSSQAIPSRQNTAGVSASLEKVVKLDEGYLFYIDMNLLEARPDFRVVAPGSASIIDSTGRKINLKLNGPQVYGATDENLWEFSTKEDVAEGPIKVVIEKAKAYYNPWDMSIPPAPEMIAAHSFTFDVGIDPQVEQTWDLAADFEIGGYRGKVISARAVMVDPQMLPFPELTTDASINRGYEFTIQSDDPAVQWNVGVSIARPEGSEGGFVDCIGYIAGEAGPTTTHTVTCRGLPSQALEATIYEVSVMLDGVWEMDWQP